MAENKIEHIGKVVEINPEFTSVELVPISACGECHAKNFCGVADEDVKIIMVPTDPYGNYELGDEVKVLLKRTMGWKGVWLGYVIPLAVLLILLLSLSAAKVHELWAGLGAIVGVGVYYLILALFRNRLARDFVFTIKELK